MAEAKCGGECIKLAIKSGGDNQNKAVTVVNQPLGPVLFHVQMPDPRAVDGSRYERRQGRGDRREE